MSFFRITYSGAVKLTRPTAYDFISLLPGLRVSHFFSLLLWVAVIGAKNHKRQRRKRQSVTAKREKSQTPKVLTAILTLPNLT